MSQHAKVEHLNPAELPRNPAFSNVVAVTGPAKMVYMGGKNAITASGEIVGKGDIAAQTDQIFHNLKAAIAAAGAKLEPSSNGTSMWWTAKHCRRRSRSSSGSGESDPTNPSLIMLAKVSGLAQPDFLAELDAVVRLAS